MASLNYKTGRVASWDQDGGCIGWNNQPVLTSINDHKLYIMQSPHSYFKRMSLKEN
jgi:hypothetical protein